MKREQSVFVGTSGLYFVVVVDSREVVKVGSGVRVAVRPPTPSDRSKLLWCHADAAHRDFGPQSKLGRTSRGRPHGKSTACREMIGAEQCKGH